MRRKERVGEVAEQNPFLRSKRTRISGRTHALSSGKAYPKGSINVTHLQGALGSVLTLKLPAVQEVLVGTRLTLLMMVADD